MIAIFLSNERNKNIAASWKVLSALESSSTGGRLPSIAEEGVDGVFSTFPPLLAPYIYQQYYVKRRLMRRGPVAHPRLRHNSATSLFVKITQPPTRRTTAGLPTSRLPPYPYTNLHLRVSLKRRTFRRSLLQISQKRNTCRRTTSSSCR